MSHITDFSAMETITDLTALQRAVQKFCPTLEYVRGESHYRTWKDDHGGQLVGDYPVPPGWTKEEVGENAVDVIRVKPEHNNGKMYEIGVVPHKQKPGHYNLIADFWAQGNGILEQPGVGRAYRPTTKPGEPREREKAFDDLLEGYAMMEVAREAERQGDTVTFNQDEEGWYADINTEARLGV